MNDEFIRTITFEARKAHLKQDKNGHVLSLVIHPDESPEQLWRDLVGQPYMVVMAPIEDAAPDPQDIEGRKALSSMRASCKDPAFQSWLGAKTEDEAVTTVKNFLQVSTSAAIRDQPLKTKEWKKLHEAYRLGSDPPVLPG